jgi:hypothetical protein
MIVRRLSAFLVCAACLAFAQQEPAPLVAIAPPAPRTALESFLARKDGIIVKEFHFLGRVGEARVETLILSQPGSTGAGPRGVRIQLTAERGENTALVDLGELDGLAKALSYMVDAISEWQGSNRDYTEMVFSTQGDLQVGFSITSGKIQSFLKTGVTGATVTAVIDSGKLSAMRDLLDEGREYLAAAKR